MRTKKEVKQEIQNKKNIIVKLRRTGLLDPMKIECFERDLTLLFWFLSHDKEEAKRRAKANVHKAVNKGD